MLETADVRRQLTHRLGEIRRASTLRRSATDTARAAFDTALEREVAPTFRQLAQALKAEGFSFSVQTPASAVRLVSDRSGDDAIEIALDVSGREPAVLARSAYTRGRRVMEDERVVCQGEAIAGLNADRTLAVLLDLLEPFVER